MFKVNPLLEAPFSIVFLSLPEDKIPSKSPSPTSNRQRLPCRCLARCFARSAAGASVPEAAADGRPCAQAAPDATATARWRMDSENVWRMDGEWMEHLWKMDGTSMDNLWNIYGKWMENHGKSNFMPRKSMKVMGANSCHERTPSRRQASLLQPIKDYVHSTQGKTVSSKTRTSTKYRKS